MEALLLALKLLVLYRIKYTEASEPGVLKNYCQKESFNPRCSNGEVILMKSATFGRMKIGRCLIVESEEEYMASNPRYLGCSNDVLQILDDKCTGKPSCDVPVLDDEFQKKNPCFKGLVSYMEAHYICVPAQSENFDCHILVRPTSPIFILSSSLRQNKCGTTEKPLIVETSAAQQIKFGIVNLNGSAWTNGCPFSLGSVHEGTPDKIKKEFCLDYMTRHKIVYSSRNNKIEILLERDKFSFHKVNHSTESFLFSIGVIGCTDLLPAEDSWMKRNGDIITIGCYSSRQTWQLKCVENKWIGVLGNCSAKQNGHSFGMAPAQIVTSKIANFEVIGMFAICGIGLVVCILVIGTGYLCAKKYSVDTKGVLEENKKFALDSDLDWRNKKLLPPETGNDVDSYEPSTYFVLDQSKVNV